MKNIIPAVLILAFTLPASARMWDFSDACNDVNGVLLGPQIVSNISVIPYENYEGTNVLSVLETTPVEDSIFSKRVFLIDNQLILDQAYIAYGTLKFTDICYEPDSVRKVIIGMRIRDE